MNVEHISLSTTPITLLKEGEEVSQGTGFFYAREFSEDRKALFLVTNFHVLTGFSPSEEKEPIGDSIEFQFHELRENPGKVRLIRYPLFTEDEERTWVQNSDYPEADLAVIPILSNVYQNCEINCIGKKWSQSDLKIRPAKEVTLVGYPYGFYDRTNALPIWKTGSLASEPKIDFEGKPLILVDVSAFPGMSGAPVFAVSHGMYETEDGPSAPGNVRQFLGIYASMQYLEENKYLEEIEQKKPGIRDKKSLQIGNVWKSKLIVETIDEVDIEWYEKKVVPKIVNQ